MSNSQTTKTCGADAAFRFTWPGSDESVVCVTHAIKLKQIAGAMGLHLQVIPLEPCSEAEHPKCPQRVG